MKRVLILLSAGAILGTSIAGCGRSPEAPGVSVGLVTFLRGKAEIVRAGKSMPVKVNDTFGQGDILRTGANGIVVAALSGRAAEIELQPGSEFRIDEYAAKSKKLALEKGNLWLRVNKRAKDEEFQLRSPTAIAGVRGTKFFTFHIKGPDGRDYHGTCHCEGQVDFQAGKGAYSAVHNRDSIVLSREGKTILLTADDLKFMGPANAEHKHSALTESPLGPQAVQLTPLQMKTFLETAERKFALVK